MAEAKPFCISKAQVWEAYLRVKANQGAAGVDGVSLKAFERDLKGNLYKIWNRMSSGSYFPPPVRLVEIPKGDGRTRPLGIPTVSDRIGQTVVKMVLEPMLEPMFHPDSYGYRPGRSALDAVGAARKRCWHKDWIIDLDIKGFFDNLDHDLVMRAVRFHAKASWICLYVERWLKAPIQDRAGTLMERTSGTPQGGVISPLLANLFMHYAFDAWMRRTSPNIQFERYADDIIVHCVSEVQAQRVLAEIRERLGQCRLELHPVKTKIVYCQDGKRRHEYENVAFDFLGYTFQPRRARDRGGKFFLSFLPAMSTKAATEIRATIRRWRLMANWSNQTLEDLARFLDPYVRSWISYYGRFYRSKARRVLFYLNLALTDWVRQKYKQFRFRKRAARHWLGRIAVRRPQLMVLWQLGIKPAAGR